jgi:hypothetical protein
MTYRLIYIENPETPRDIISMNLNDAVTKFCEMFLSGDYWEASIWNDETGVQIAYFKQEHY